MTKELLHGLPASRAKAGHDPGISPDPTRIRLLLGLVRYATQNPPAGEGVNRRHDRSGTAPEHSCKGRGWRKPSGTAVGPRHRASRGYGSGSVGTVSVYRGTVAGGGAVSNRKARERMKVSRVFKLVPMPLFLGGGVVAGGGYAFSLCALWAGWMI